MAHRGHRGGIFQDSRSPFVQLLNFGVADQDSCEAPDKPVDVLLRAMWSPGRKQIALSCGGLQILRWREQAFSEDALATLAPEPESTATDSASTLHDPFVCSGNHGRQGSGCIDQDN